MMKRQDRLADYRLTDHARFEMIRRQISEEEVARILSNPEQVLEVRPSRFNYQARVKIGESSKTYLLRVFVDNDRNPPEVVTVYRTEKLTNIGEVSHESSL